MSSNSSTAGSRRGGGSGEGMAGGGEPADAVMQALFTDIQIAAAELARTAPPGLALFEYWDLLVAKTGGAPIRDLFAAATAGDVRTTRSLLRQPGVDVNHTDKDAVHDDARVDCACYDDARTDEYGNDYGVTAMYIAAAHGHTELVEVLADEGNADVNKCCFPQGSRHGAR